MSTFTRNQPVKLTKTIVDRAQLPARGQTFVRDAVLRGFGLRITATGTKAFIVEKRIHGRVRRQTIGRYGELTCEQARNQAQHILGKIAIGEDPIAEKRRARSQAVTLTQAFDAYLKARKTLAAKTVRDYTRCMERDFKDWRTKSIVSITKHMVSQRHRQLGETRGEAYANDALRFLRALLNFSKHTYEDGKGHSILSYNPVEILNHARAWYQVDHRCTYIKVHELPAWYAAVQSLKDDTQPITARVVADYLIFVIFTGLRRNEAAKLTWNNVDLKARTFTIPHTKNRVPHTLPITAPIYTLLLERHAYALNEYVFPGRDGIGSLVEPKRQLQHVRDQAGVYFTIHDLRRTFATIADSLEITPYTIKRLLNHKMGNDVTAGYIISDVGRLYEPMEKISAFIEKALGMQENNVVQFPAHGNT